jgi:hypothetical protein
MGIFDEFYKGPSELLQMLSNFDIFSFLLTPNQLK